MVGLIMVPALSLLDRSGRIDRAAGVAYAQRAEETWLDLFLIAGSLGAGGDLTGGQRRSLLGLWLEHAAPSRLVACCWTPDEVERSAELGVRPMAVLRDCQTSAALLTALRDLTSECFVYSHPQYTATTLSASLAKEARAEGSLPAGAKVSKIDLDEVRALREAAGPGFQLFDGRCRHVRSSVEAGATGVVAVPLSVIPADLPPKDDLDGVQAVIDRYQAVVDAELDVTSQAGALKQILLADL